jgi:fermentation-respiration switch protein FrsA (DUF1100 family)
MGRRRLLKLVGLFVLLYLAGIATLYLFQRPLLYGNKFRELKIQPAMAGLTKAEVIKFSTADGEVLTGWYVRPTNDLQTFYLYFHGKAGSLGNRAAQFAALTRSGHGLLAIDYRGFGDSTGFPSEPGLYRDAEAAFDWLAKLIDPKRIAIIGESLGTGVAIWLAARRPAGALILLAPYTSISDIAALQYPLFPVRRLLVDQFRSDLEIKKVHIPLLIVHGTADRTIPIASGLALFDMANEPKLFLRSEGAGHKNLVQLGAFDGIAAFVADVIERRTQDH